MIGSQMLSSDVDANKWLTLNKRVQESYIAVAIDMFRQQGVEPILIKGWAAARNYPIDRHRNLGDIDLTVSPSDYDRARGLAQKPELLIDLHCGLRHLDSLDWDDLFERSRLVDLNGTAVRILCDEDHLRVLCTHWLVDGGQYRDKLWDIYYAVDRRHADFDWSRCLDRVEPHRRRWVICVIGLAHRYLGLGIDDLQFADEARDLPRWLTKCVEREWHRSGRLEPVLSSTRDVTLFLNQVRRRLPPNPIRCTIEENGDLYGGWRWWYQLKVLTRRSIQFVRDLVDYFRIVSRRQNTVSE